MKKVICVILIFATLFMSANALAFTDVTKDHWASDYIAELSSLEIIDGYEDGSFNPDGNVTRAEFAKMLCLAFETKKSDVSYADTSDHWAKEYIESTSDYVYTPSDKYLPDAWATRAEIAYALSGVLNLVDSNVETLSFSDWDTVDKAMADKVLLAVANGIIEGYEDGTIRGDGNVTRAEACALIARAINFEMPDAELPPETEAPSKPEQEEPQKPETPKDPLYTAYPLKDLMLVVSLTTVMGDGGADVDYRLTYRIAGGEEEYTTVLKGDANTVVGGTKTTVASLSEGDVFVFDTAFHGHIDTIYVLASLEQGEVVSIPGSFALGSGGEYAAFAGKVVSRAVKSKSVVLGIQSGETTLSVTVPNGAYAVIYNEGKGNPWLEDSPKGIEEGMFVFVRYTKSKVTEVVALQK